MKALTLTQPWATLVAIGAKRIETRSWATSYCGPLAIHAGAGLGPVGGAQGLMELCRSEPFRSTLLAAGILGTPALPRGAIVATCQLVDCVRADLWGQVTRDGETWQIPPGNMSLEYAFGDYSPGRWAWLMADVTPLAEPIPVRGALGLWEWGER